MDMQTISHPSLFVSQDELRAKYDHTPFGFTHDLHTSAVFAAAALEQLAAAYDGHPADYFVAGSAPTPGTVFYDVEARQATPAEALARLDAAPTRVLLKRPERYDNAFHDLLERLFDTVARQQCTLRRQDLVRLEGAVLITSAAAITPFHFDPEVNFFFQIEGPKTYHLYPPATVTTAELERFYRRAAIDIAQIDLAARDPAQEFVFDLRPGLGLHQPQNAPHWVQTHAERSVSYTMVFETRAARIRNRARGTNYFLRRAGLAPAHPGVHAGRDLVKARLLQVAARIKRSI